jgi:hypothetical protein
VDTAGTRGTITAIEDEAATDIAIEARRELLGNHMLRPALNAGPLVEDKSTSNPYEVFP